MLFANAAWFKILGLEIATGLYATHVANHIVGQFAVECVAGAAALSNAAGASGDLSFRVGHRC